MELSATARVKEVEIKKRKFTFEIETDKRTFPVSAESEASKQAWIDSLNKAIKQMGGGGGPTPPPTGGTPPPVANGTKDTGPITTPPTINSGGKVYAFNFYVPFG